MRGGSPRFRRPPHLVRVRARARARARVSKPNPNLGSGGQRTVGVGVGVGVPSGGLAEHHEELLQLLLHIPRVLSPRQHVLLELCRIEMAVSVLVRGRGRVKG